MAAEKPEMGKKEVIEIYGPTFDCFGNPIESCLKNYNKEPCRTCIETYRKDLLEKPRFHEARKR